MLVRGQEYTQWPGRLGYTAGDGLACRPKAAMEARAMSRAIGKDAELSRSKWLDSGYTTALTMDTFECSNNSAAQSIVQLANGLTASSDARVKNKAGLIGNILGRQNAIN